MKKRRITALVFSQRFEWLGIFYFSFFKNLDVSSDPASAFLSITTMKLDLTAFSNQYTDNMAPHEEALERSLLASFEEDESGQILDVFEDTIATGESLPTVEICPTRDIFKTINEPEGEEMEHHRFKSDEEGVQKGGNAKPDAAHSSSESISNDVKKQMNFYCTSMSDSSRPQNSLIALAMNGRNKRKPAPSKKLKPLPAYFQPSQYSVLCGKGSDNYNSIGKKFMCEIYVVFSLCSYQMLTSFNFLLHTFRKSPLPAHCETLFGPV